VLIQSGRPQENIVFKDGSTSSIPSYPSVEQGYGRVTLGDVLNFGSSEGEHLALFVRGGARRGDMHYVSFNESGEWHTYEFSVGDIPPPKIRVTVTYTDIAAYPSQSVVLINRIVLTVSNMETGEIHERINKAFSEDNVLVVDISAPYPNSSYVVKVLAANIVAEQSYALVMTGSISSSFVFSSGADESEPYTFNYSMARFACKMITLLLLVLVLGLATWRYFSDCERKLSFREFEGIVNVSSRDRTDARL
jgi:hypothetical protein